MASAGEVSILVVEDEDDVFGQISEALVILDVTFDRASTCQAALKAAAGQAYSLIVLDRQLPDGDALSVLTRLREMDVFTPTLILSNMIMTRNRIEGLEGGASDYLTKPFDNGELVARIKAILRDTNDFPQSEIIVIGDLEVRMQARTVHWKNEYVKLAPQSFSILAVLAQNEGEVVSREHIWRQVWTDYPNLPPQEGPMDVAMSRLREDLSAVIPKEDVKKLLRTERGKGLVLGPKK